jgi:hypothetical protein
MSNYLDTPGKLLERNSNKQPEGLAAVSGKNRMTYGELNNEVNILARGLFQH